MSCFRSCPMFGGAYIIPQYKFVSRSQLGRLSELGSFIGLGIYLPISILRLSSFMGQTEA